MSSLTLLERFHRRVSDLFHDFSRTPTEILAAFGLQSGQSGLSGKHHTPRPSSGGETRGERLIRFCDE